MFVSEELFITIKIKSLSIYICIYYKTFCCSFIILDAIYIAEIKRNVKNETYKCISILLVLLKTLLRNNDIDNA